MKVLFLHDNFPAQFGAVGRYLARQGWRVVFGTQRKGSRMSGIQVVNYKPHREVSTGTHRYARPLEQAVLCGQAVARMGLDLRKAGFRPDVVVAHSGWGPGLYVKDVWPDTRLVGYYEWYYETTGPDTLFLHGEPELDQQLFARSRNAPIIMDLVNGDWGITPTRFQRDRFPAMFHERLSIQHDGVDTDFFAPDPGVPLGLPGIDVRAGDEIVTYAARGMEPYRGFPQFMAALALLQKRRPRLHAVIMGADRVAYGKQPKDGKSYKQRALEEYDLDLARVHFPGLLPLNRYRDVLRHSGAHIYLTIPFVLSWSMLEAMSTGCLLIGSNTGPVREVVEDGCNGLLVDFFDIEGIAARIGEVLDAPEKFSGMRAAARRTILERYAAVNLYREKMELLERVVSAALPAAVSAEVP